MGTRYQYDDYVFYGGRLAQILDVRNPKSSSPDYVLNFLDDKEHPPEEYNVEGEKFSASDLRKVELDGHSPDYIVKDIEKEAEKQANRSSALVWSNNGRHEEADMIIAQFGEFYGVNGNDVQTHRPDTNGMVRISDKGGSIPSAEAEVDIQEVCHEVSKNYERIPRESIDRIAKAEFGTDAGMRYIVTSGQATHYKKVNQ